MRTTVIERLHAERKVPYDPDAHPMLDIKPEPRLTFIETGPRVLALRFEFRVSFVEQVTGVEHGFVDCSALIRVENDSITTSPRTTPDNIFSLLQGGIGDEVLLPVSMLCRTLRLPTLVLSPIRVTRETLEVKSDVAERKTDDNSKSALVKTPKKK